MCALLFVTRMTVVAEVWTQHRDDLADLRAVIAKVPPGAIVTFTNVPQEEAPAYWDAGPRARRLSNGLRAIITCRSVADRTRGLLAHAVRQPGAATHPTAPRIREARARGPRHSPHADLVTDPDRSLPALRDFDFVLMLEAGADPNLAGFMPRCLNLMTQTDFAALFRIKHDNPAVHRDYFAAFAFLRGAAFAPAARAAPGFLTRAFFAPRQPSPARRPSRARRAAGPPPIPPTRDDPALDQKPHRCAP